MGEKLEKIAFIVGEKVHPFSSKNEKIMDDLKRYKTLIHGDPKQVCYLSFNIHVLTINFSSMEMRIQANIFFKEENNKLEVGLIDFQWSGFGLAGTDIAHHITAAVHASCLSHDGEKENTLLDYYHSLLSKYLVQYGVAQSEQEVEDVYFPRSVLQGEIL